MTKLSQSLTQLKAQYDTIVIGSGYGGGIAASRMARMGDSVCLLERGEEIAVGDFPDDLSSAAKQLQLSSKNKHIGNKTGLFDIHINDDINVVVGCGLGGTSLINANVSLQADSRVFDDAQWPESIRTEAKNKNSLLHQSYRRAEVMLQPRPYPEHSLSKTLAHHKSAQTMNLPFSKPPINVVFEDGISPAGIRQAACTECGDCITGCNIGAKNTTAMNYLPDAVNHGADIFTAMQVSHLEQDKDGWNVFFSIADSGQDSFDSPLLFIHAKRVMLGAGTLGSTEILLRSKQKGLSISNMLGKRFTGNGDVLAFGYNCDQKINGIGFGKDNKKNIQAVGPCITSVIDNRNTENLDDGMVIEEGSLPTVMNTLLPGVFSLASKTIGVDTDDDFWDDIKEVAREIESKARGSYHGAVNNTQTYLVMAHDDSNGEMKLEKNNLNVHWPNVGKQAIFKKISDNIKSATSALGGTYIPNPVWNKYFGHDLITVHPLGGCPMGVSAENAAVNDKGQVYSENDNVYKNLFVCDGAIIPRSLGVNPLLTICALAERICSLIAKDANQNDGYSETSKPQEITLPSRIGIQFTERMAGKFLLSADASFQQGEKNGDDFNFIFTISADDVEQLTETEGHKACITGIVNAPALSTAPLCVIAGTFQLLIKDPDVVGQRRMVYSCTMRSVEGKEYIFDGYKLIHDDRSFDVWDDTTTLFITVKEKNNPKNILGRGILHISPKDFATQLTTVKTLNTKNLKQSTMAVSKFVRYFSGSVIETYGGILTPDYIFDPSRPKRKKRTLNLPAPSTHIFSTEDNIEIKLTRYNAGNKGPVMLVHGLGVSSKIFTLDTIDTNLTEHLAKEGYDIWLIDNRSSIESSTSNEAHNADSIAKYDYPAAVKTILNETGKADLQVIAHCYGGTTFCMSLLLGLSGVRSLVLSQTATHYSPSMLNKFKAGLYLPSLLDHLGIDSLTAYRDNNANWLEKLYDGALRLYPQESEERGYSPIDRRINFMYGQLWELDQINTSTYETLHETFGIANIKAFEQLALIMRKGQLVDAEGNDIYLPHAERMALPIRFIHGAENAAFLARGTLNSMDFLSQQNSADLYDRFVIENYGHIDCIFGKNANEDVFPLISEHLNLHS